MFVNRGHSKHLGIYMQNSLRFSNDKGGKAQKGEPSRSPEISTRFRWNINRALRQTVGWTLLRANTLHWPFGQFNRSRRRSLITRGPCPIRGHDPTSADVRSSSRPRAPNFRQIFMRSNEPIDTYYCVSLFVSFLFFLRGTLIEFDDTWVGKRTVVPLKLRYGVVPW